MDIPLAVLLLTGLVVSAVACVMTRNLLKASIALAVVSAILASIMFMLEAPLAAVFELSVCAGLITVIFISAISMTRVHRKEELVELERARIKRFIPLPFLLIALIAASLYLFSPYLNTLAPSAAPPRAESEPEVFWNQRQADLLGQIIIVLAGVYGVLIFFKEPEKQ